MAKFEAVVVPPDEVHIVNTGKGQFIHTSLKNPKYWLTPWKKVYKIPLKAIPIRVSVPVSHTGNLQIILEMEIVFKLRDPELAVKSLGGDIDQLKITVEGTIKASTRQAALKYPIENILDFYSNVTKEGRASVEGLVHELGFDIISFDIMNIHKKRDVAEEQTVPMSGHYGDNGDNICATPGEAMPMMAPLISGTGDGDNGGMIAASNVPMLPAGAAGENTAVPSGQYSAPPFPTAQPGEMPDYREPMPDHREPMQEEAASHFTPPSPPENDQRRTDWQYNQQRNVAIKSAFDNFQYSRDDLKWGENQQGMNVPANESSYATINDGGNQAVLQDPTHMEESLPMMEPQGEMPFPVEGQTPMIPASPTLIPSSHIQEKSGETVMMEESVEEVREVREEVSESYESYKEEVWDAENFVGRMPEEKYKKEAEGVIKEIKGIISRIRRKGMVLPPSPINTYLTNITDNIESGHYLDATKLGRECLTYLEETEVLFEDVRDEVIKLQDWISALKTSKVPLGEAEDRFNLVIDLFKNAEYQEARDKAAICRKLMNKKKTLYEEADNAIKEAWQLMKHAAPLGWEVSKARILLDEAKEAAEREEYEDALEKAQLAQDVIQAHFDSLKGIWLKIREIGDVATKAHEDSLTEIQARLDKFGEKMDEILTLGVKITPALNEELLEVEDALSRYDIYEAKHLIEDLETTIEELKELHERAKLKYERANLRAEETKSITKDVRPMMYLLGAMDDALKVGDYELVSDLSDEIQELCDTREEGDTLFKALAMMESAGRIAEECKELGMDVIDVNPLLRDG